MPRYTIAETYDSHHERLMSIEADTATDALALYAIGEGFADPRVYIGTEEDFYYTLRDGTRGMVFTNTELVAIREEN